MTANGGKKAASRYGEAKWPLTFFQISKIKTASIIWREAIAEERYRPSYVAFGDEYGVINTLKIAPLYHKMLKKYEFYDKICVVIVGAPTSIWMLGHIVRRGQPCCPWDEVQTAAFQVAPFSISVGVIFALGVSVYEELLKTIKDRQR